METSITLAPTYEHSHVLPHLPARFWLVELPLWDFEDGCRYRGWSAARNKACLFTEDSLAAMLLHVPPPIDLDKTLGAVFIGNVVSAALFGLTSLQTFTFFKGNTRDQRFFKRLIGFLWLLDLVHLVFMTHGVYSYLITNYNNLLALSNPTWSLLAQVITTCLSDSIVRCVFARRIWLLSGRNKVLFFTIIGSTMATFAMGTAFAIRGYIVGSFAGLISESWILYAAFGSSIVVDGIITVSLCLLLKSIRTGFKSMDSLLHTLMFYSINTSLLTSLCATACFVTFAIWPHQFVFVGFYFVLSKLYLNSLLAVLNTREALRKRNTGMTSMPHSPSSIDITIDFIPAETTTCAIVVKAS